MLYIEEAGYEDGYIEWDGLDDRIDDLEARMGTEINAPLDWFSDETKDINIVFNIHAGLADGSGVIIECYNLETNMKLILFKATAVIVAGNIVTWSTDGFYVRPNVPVNLLMVAYKETEPSKKYHSILQCKQRNTQSTNNISTLQGRIIW